MSKRFFSLFKYSNSVWESVGTLWASKFNSKSRNLWRAADMGRSVLLISTGFLCVQLEMQCYRFPNCSMFIQPKHVLSAASHLQMQSIHLHKIRHVFRFIETFFSCWYVYLWCNVQTHKKKTNPQMKTIQSRMVHTDALSMGSFPLCTFTDSYDLDMQTWMQKALKRFSSSLFSIVACKSHKTLQCSNHHQPRIRAQCTRYRIN